MRHLLYTVVTLSLLLSGCNYLDVVPESDIETIETIFEKRENAETWLQGCHLFFNLPMTSMVENPAYLGADEVVASEAVRQKGTWKGLYIGDGLQMSQEPYGNIWKKDQFYAGIRHCNIFFEKIGNVYNMQEEEKQLWTAELKALKANFYFELMRRYGPIILVPENIDANATIDIMTQPRSPIDSCVKAIVDLLDEAMKVLPPLRMKAQNRRAYHSLESAAALKAQVLLYAASPLFNGNPMYANFKNKAGQLLFSQTEDREKWKTAALAAEEAIELCLQNGKKLISEVAVKPTQLLRTMKDIETSVLAMNYVNDEAVFMVRPVNNEEAFWYIWTLPYFKSTDTDYNSDLYGGVSPSMKMVEMYYTEHGLPIQFDKVWNYSTRYQMGKEGSAQYKNVIPLNTDVLGLHLRREPRFYAHIAADGCYWPRGQDADLNPRPIDIVTAYRGGRFGTQFSFINNSVRQNLSGYWLKKGIYSDIMNRTYNSILSRDEGMILMRLADLYLMKAEAWNEYEGPLVNRSHVYEPLNEVRARAGIPDVETAWMEYSNTPDKVKTKEGMREIIQQEWNIEFAFEGRRFWNLRRWLTASDELNAKLYGWNILGETAQKFYNNYEGPVVVWSKRGFQSPRDYFFPIRSEEVMIANCVQNPGW